MSEVTYGIIGISNLWPWNCLLTAAMFIGPYLHEHPNLQRNYSSSMMLVFTGINLIVVTNLVWLPRHFGWRIRFGEAVIGSGMLLMSLLTVFRAPPVIYFNSIMALTMFIAVGSTHIQNGVTAITQRIPGGKEARAVLIGQALAGIMPPILGLVMGLTHHGDVAVPPTELNRSATSTLVRQTATTDNANIAIVLFLSSSVLCAYVLYKYRGATVQSHIELSETSNEWAGIDGTSPSTPSGKELMDLLRHLKAPCLTIFLSYGVSLAYSVFANNVTSRTIDASVFSPLTHLVWNSGDLVGRILCESEALQIANPGVMVQYSVLRILFLPTLILLAWLGNPSNFLYLVLMLAFGITNGHLISSSISYAPSCVEPDQRPSAGGVISWTIGWGLAAGAALSFVVVPFASSTHA